MMPLLMRMQRQTNLLISLMLVVVLLTLATATASKSTSNNNILRANHNDNIETRVVGGSRVEDPGTYPYFVEWHDQYCGGVLIHDDLVLTAAHCIANSDVTERVYMYVNTRRGTGDRDVRVERRVIDYQTHPYYKEEWSTRDWDYLVLKLDRSALVRGDGETKTGAQVISINTDPDIPEAGDALLAMGFGSTREQNPGMSDVLREATVYAYDESTCRRQYGRYFEPDYMFCSGVDGGGVDTCQGDSGGPLVHEETGKLVGLVSFGTGCARADKFGVNSRVSAAASWLESLMCQWSEYPNCGRQEEAPVFPPTAAPTFVPTEISTEPPTYSPVSTPEPTTESTPQPTTESTPQPTPQPNKAENLGSLSIIFKPDQYPEEIAWSFGDSEGNTFLFEPYGNVTKAGGRFKERFDNLQPTSQYIFKVSDLKGDGVCCMYGDGFIRIVDHTNEDSVVWSSRGDYGRYFEVELAIDFDTGHAYVSRQSGEYQPSTWKDLEQMLAPDNAPGWPGELPNEDTFSIMVNVNTDDFPEETMWELYHKPDETVDEWVLVDAWIGEGVAYRSLDNREIPNLLPGWHRFSIFDTHGDGNCCEHGSGYISLTGPIAVAGGEKGLIWGSDGSFWSFDEVFFHVDESGYISRIRYTEA